MRRLEGTVLDNPKSHRVISHSWFIKIFAGLISLCITLAEWMKLRAHSALYRIVIMCPSSNSMSLILFKSCFKSQSDDSITIKIYFISSRLVGVITSMSFVVNLLFFISESCLNIVTSLIIFLLWYSSLKRSVRSLIATIF